MTAAFRVEVREGVAVATLDVPGEPVNVFTGDVRREFAGLLDRLAGEEELRALVLVSGKPDNFVAGADINEFLLLRDAEEATRLSREGQTLLDRVAASPKPIVVAIHGACLGGGLELALACHFRLASDHAATTLGLPEVQLGVIPGAGGCNRLPRVVGLRAALEMILTGKAVRPATARRIGLVDEVVPRELLEVEAVRAARRLASGDPPRRSPRGGVAGLLLDRNAAGRAIVLWQARRETLRRTRGHYPAPLAAIDAVCEGLARGPERGLRREAELFGRLAAGDVSHRMVEIFFASRSLRKEPVGQGEGPPADVRQLGIVGAGFMGAGIAALAAVRAGVPVRLRDTDLGRVGAGLRSAAREIGDRVRRRSATPLEAVRHLALISGAADHSGLRRADLIIEAVVEDLAVKREVLRQIESVTGPDCVFASNTSTIPISSIAEGAVRPGNVVGMHFFSPVGRMPLLEVVAPDRAGPRSVATAVAFGRRLGKTVVVVRDRPGFFVNRILAPYLAEAGRVLAEGARAEAVDREMTDWGFPVGPLALMDEIGLDVAAGAAKVLAAAYGSRLAPAINLGALVAEGRLGRKKGGGFYRYRNGRRNAEDAGSRRALGIGPAARGRPDREVARRLAFAMLNEAARALQEGVVRSPRDGDIAAVYGLGFPPFRGGPFRALDALGAATAADILERLARDFGDRYEPAPLLADLARRNGRFHSDRQDLCSAKP